MCTAATYKTKDFYFGRTLDYDFSYGDEIVITPRKYTFNFENLHTINEHYAMIGVAHVADNYPLYYDAINEKGLAMAGLNFVGNAVYNDKIDGKYNVKSYDFLQWVLSQCATVDEAKKLLKEVNIVKGSFNENLSCAQLHWIIAANGTALTVEATEAGFSVYDNPVGILTNNPTFGEQMFSLNNYMSLSAKEPTNNFCTKLPLKVYSRGMGALGLPGDLSSQSRFIRAAFVKTNSICRDTEEESVSQFFHILGSVEQQRGCCVLDDGKYEVTLYTSCCNTDKGIYYYTTYDNHQISAIDMHREDLDSSELIKFPLIRTEQIRMQN